MKTVVLIVASAAAAVILGSLIAWQIDARRERDLFDAERDRLDREGQ